MAASRRASPARRRGIPTARSRRRRGWVRVEKDAQRKIVATTEDAEFALLRIGVRHVPQIHSHRESQVGVIISGAGVHRMLLSVRRGRRTVKQVTELLLRPGDCYFIPPDVPHEFQVEGNRPVVALDVTLAKPRRRAGRLD
ncbi:MAG TPA: cupin domain-containing protein [Thermoplasmata archaeon]